MTAIAFEVELRPGPDRPGEDHAAVGRVAATSDAAPPRVPGGLHTARVIASAELRAALGGRVVQGFGLLFLLFAGGIAVAGLGASGQLIVQGFTRTAVSLLSLALYALPLLGLVLGAGAFGDGRGGAELLLAQPVDRTATLLARAAGLGAAVWAVTLAGFGGVGVLVAATAGTAGLAGYGVVALGAGLVATAALSAGALIGVMSRRRATAVGAALAAWLGAAVLYDLACIAVLQLVGDGQPGPSLVALLGLNPIDGVRALSLVALGADVLLGPTGAALQRLLGAPLGLAWVLGSLALWITLPLAAAAAVHRRRDF